MSPWRGEEGKRAFFRNLQRLNPEYTLAIAGALKQLPHDTLILWGCHDPFQNPTYAEKLRATLLHARLEWIDAGHWFTEERPDDVARIIDTFLKQ